MNCIPPASMKYFFGRITRDEAEMILRERGLIDGTYLLRESVNTQGNYALSLCYQAKVHHYSIEKNYDGTVMIQDGKKFRGPVELVQHHEKYLDGFLIKPSIPIERGDKAPMAFRGVTMLELEQLLLKKVDELKLTGDAVQNALGPQRNQFVNLVAKDLHEQQPWYHQEITRDASETVLNSSGHGDGKFLIRMREKGGKSFALSISHSGCVKHYRIDRHPSGKLAIEDGPQFDSLMQLVDHYYNKSDGLLCKLTEPCVRPNYVKREYGLGTQLDDNVAYSTNPRVSQQNGLQPEGEHGIYAEAEDIPPRSPHRRGPLPQVPASNHSSPPISPTPKPLPPTPVMSPVRTSSPQGAVGGAMRLSDEMNDSEGVYGSVEVRTAVWDDPTDQLDFGTSVPVPAASVFQDEDPQKIYDSVPRTEDVFNLSRKQLDLQGQLGAGCFGSVLKGTYKPPMGKAIPVAVKTLKGDMPSQQDEIMKEAKIMADLDHRNIVRMIGVCRDETLMLVLELAPEGPLNKYLKSHPKMSMKSILNIMYQVAVGMEYLESVKFVHRDLAARNVLLVSEDFAKISDFGMSKALGIGNEYYKAETAGKWPLKWYAPECIYYFKFDSKSDVWSYGVTLWEATTYGQKPYKGLKGQEILQMIEAKKRLERPPQCPADVYQIMHKCWQYRKKERPTFAGLASMMNKYKK